MISGWSAVDVAALAAVFSAIASVGAAVAAVVAILDARASRKNSALLRTDRELVAVQHALAALADRIVARAPDREIALARWRLRSLVQIQSSGWLTLEAVRLANGEPAAITPVRLRAAIREVDEARFNLWRSTGGGEVVGVGDPGEPLSPVD